MNTRTTLMAGAALLVLGIGTYALTRKSGDSADASKAPQAKERTVSRSTGSSDDGATAGKAERPSRPASEAPGAELAGKYGESRTNLSRHVVQSMTGLLDDVLGLVDLAEEGGLGAGMKMNGANLGALPGKLSLNDEQKAAAEKLAAEHQKRQIGKVKTAVADLKKKPEALMEAVLAGDAVARKQMDQSEYETIVKGLDQDLLAQLSGGPKGMDLNNQDPIADPEFRQGLEAVLEPSQLETFRGLVAENEAEEKAPADKPVMPPMELEKLDQTLGSTRQMVSGMRQMLEGVKGLPEGLLNGGDK